MWFDFKLQLIVSAASKIPAKKCIKETQNVTILFILPIFCRNPRINLYLTKFKRWSKIRTHIVRNISFDNHKACDSQNLNPQIINSRIPSIINILSGPLGNHYNYSARRLMGSRIIESAAYCNQISLAQVYINRAQNTSVNWIIRLLLSLVWWPKVILLSGGHCISFHFFSLNI